MIVENNQNVVKQSNNDFILAKKRHTAFHRQFFCRKTNQIGNIVFYFNIAKVESLPDIVFLKVTNLF